MNFLVYKPEARTSFGELISVRLQPAYRKILWVLNMYKLRL